MIVLNSLATAKELVDKRGSIYSDRPRFVLFSELYAFLSPLATLRLTPWAEWGGNMLRHTRDSEHLTLVLSA